MIRTVTIEDYEEIKSLMIQVHQLHCHDRPDLYVDSDPLSHEYFEQLCHDPDMHNYVEEEDGIIRGLLLAVKRTNRPLPITKPRTIFL